MKRQRHDPEQGIGNRQAAMFAKKCHHWCNKCDGYLVGPGEKCPSCGGVDRKGERRGKNISKKRKRKL